MILPANPAFSSRNRMSICEKCRRQYRNGSSSVSYAVRRTQQRLMSVMRKEQSRITSSGVCTGISPLPPPGSSGSGITAAHSGSQVSRHSIRRSSAPGANGPLSVWSFRNFPVPSAMAREKFRSPGIASSSRRQRMRSGNRAANSAHTSGVASGDTLSERNRSTLPSWNGRAATMDSSVARSMSARPYVGMQMLKSRSVPMILSVFV